LIHAFILDAFNNTSEEIHLETCCICGKVYTESVNVFLSLHLQNVFKKNFSNEHFYLGLNIDFIAHKGIEHY